MVPTVSPLANMSKLFMASEGCVGKKLVGDFPYKEDSFAGFESFVRKNYGRVKNLD